MKAKWYKFQWSSAAKAYDCHICIEENQGNKFHFVATTYFPLDFMRGQDLTAAWRFVGSCDDSHQPLKRCSDLILKAFEEELITECLAKGKQGVNDGHRT